MAAGVSLPWPLRAGLDVVLLAGSALVFWLTSRGGYQVVVAPEGVPVVSVNYAALLAPALAWLGLGLLMWRLVWVGLGWPLRLPSDCGPRLGDLRRHDALGGAAGSLPGRPPAWPQRWE